MVNYLHPGFQRALPPAIQIMCSERILYAMNLDNLLLARDLVWLHNGSEVAVTSKLLPVMLPPGFAVTEISNTPVIEGLGLPYLHPDEAYALMVAGTGTYCFNGSNEILTGARCVELDNARRAGNTGSQDDYNHLALQLPQHTRVAYALIPVEPQNYDAARFGGAWPSGGVTVVKMLYPPSYASHRNAGNWRTATLCFTQLDNPTNHLSMAPILRRLMGHSCTCRSGKRVNSTCRHTTAALKALCVPGSFRSTKKMATQMGDVNRPDDQEPRSCGQPAVPATPQQATTPTPAPPRLSRESRNNARNQFLRGFGDPQPRSPSPLRRGYGPQFAAPGAQDGSPGGGGADDGQSGDRGGGGAEDGQDGEQGGGGAEDGQDGGDGGGGDNVPKRMLNGDNGCFAVSSFLFLVGIEADLNMHPNAPRSVVNRQLEQTFLRMCHNYRDPNHPPFGPEDLIQAANACLPAGTAIQNRFVGGFNACAMEFLSRDPGGLLFNMALGHGFLVHYMQQGQCNICDGHFQEMLPTPVLDLAVPLLPVGAPPIDLRPLLQAALTTPTTLTHLLCGRWCTNRDLPCTLVPQPGQVQIINLARFNGRVDLAANRVATRVSEPLQGDQVWGGRRPIAVLTQQPGHWITYLHQGGMWWRLDSVGRGVRPSNPFDDQSAHLVIKFIAFA